MQEATNNNNIEVNAEKISKNDFIYIDYDEWEVSDSKETLIDTTIKEHADASGFSKDQFAPLALIVGAGHVIKGIDQHLENMYVGKDESFILKPEEAYGPRETSKVKLYSIAEVKRSLKRFRIEEPLSVGMDIPMVTGVNSNGEEDVDVGKVVGLTAGRVRIDFNKKHSGKTIKFTVRINKKVTAIPEKVKVIIEHYYGKCDDFKLEEGNNTLTITIPERTWADHEWFHAKPQIPSAIWEYIDKKITVVIKEEHFGVEETVEQKLDEGKIEEKKDDPSKDVTDKK